MATRAGPRDYLAQEGRNGDAEAMINEAGKSSENVMKQGPGVRQAQRSAAQLQRYWRPGAGGSEVDSWVLEKSAVRQRTAEQCCQRLLDFLYRCDKADRKLNATKEVNMSLVWYLTDLFRRGWDLLKSVYTEIGLVPKYPLYGWHEQAAHSNRYQKLPPETREYHGLCAGRPEKMFLGGKPVKAPPRAV